REALTASHAIADANLSTRIRTEELFVDDHAGTPRVDAAVLDLIAELFQVRLRFACFRARVFERRLFLCELQPRQLLVSRVGEADDDVSALAREREILFALLELVG